MNYKISSILSCAVVVISAFTNSALSQTTTPFACATQAEAATDGVYDVYIFSHPGCAYSRRAIKDLGTWAKDKPVNLIALNTQGDIEKIKLSDNYEMYRKNNIQLVDATECPERYKNLVPQVYIYDRSTGKAVMKMKGWGKDDIQKVKKKLVI